jgi:hypothetical protein
LPSVERPPATATPPRTPACPFSSLQTGAADPITRQRAKGKAGLADYHVRTWEGWHHHQTSALLATWFLTKKNLAGKKYKRLR